MPCNSGYHYAPECPQKENPSPLPKSCKKTSRPALFLNCFGISPLYATTQSNGLRRIRAPVWTFFLDEPGISGAIRLCAGRLRRGDGYWATADSVRYQWLDNRNPYLRKMAPRKVISYPTIARFQFGGGRVGDLRYATERLPIRC